MTRPRHPCGSALDSCCEDMESGMFLLISGLRLFGNHAHLARPADTRLTQQVARAADWVLSWTYTWNVPLLPGTILDSADSARKAGAKCRCKTVVVARLPRRRPRRLGPPNSVGFQPLGSATSRCRIAICHVFSAAAEFLHFGKHGGWRAGRNTIGIRRPHADPHCPHDRAPLSAAGVWMKKGSKPNSTPDKLRSAPA